MAKYSFRFKKKIIQEYLHGKGSYLFLARKYKIGNNDRQQVFKWVNDFNEIGDEGLIRSRKKDTYSFDFKIHMVELYLSKEVSYQELALSVKINNPAILAKWVNDFPIAGPDAF